MADKDVTALVEFKDNDGEALPLIKCVCGATFAAWDCIISLYRDMANPCPKCGCQLYFRSSITVFEVVEE